jgi:hypothetical protein
MFLSQENCHDDVMRPLWHCRACFEETHPADGSKPDVAGSEDPIPEGPTPDAPAEAVGPAPLQLPPTSYLEAFP